MTYKRWLIKLIIWIIKKNNLIPHTQNYVFKLGREPVTLAHLFSSSKVVFFFLFNKTISILYTFL